MQQSQRKEILPSVGLSGFKSVGRKRKTELATCIKQVVSTRVPSRLGETSLHHCLSEESGCAWKERRWKNFTPEHIGIGVQIKMRGFRKKQTFFF